MVMDVCDMLGICGSVCVLVVRTSGKNKDIESDGLNLWI